MSTKLLSLEANPQFHHPRIEMFVRLIAKIDVVHSFRHSQTLQV